MRGTCESLGPSWGPGTTTRASRGASVFAAVIGQSLFAQGKITRCKAQIIGADPNVEAVQPSFLRHV